uniref:Nudix hydrolase domain-containing protein n=1 Tax=Dunaliella tertiolecta TaxID=3047 RepID=A0A7S3VQ33_DUNTE|mmetsp:Transcript_16980/g.46973  ORF Transcript_16980/g.46973 Transcript_16980/m.46973 type:complete len:336 (+) Transcript_16980:136-1143(+)
MLLGLSNSSGRALCRRTFGKQVHSQSIKRSSRGAATMEPQTLQMPSLSGFMQRIKECNEGMEAFSTLKPFLVNGKKVGHFKPEFVEHLSHYPSVFHVSESQVSLASELDTPEKRTAQVARVLEELRDKKVIGGWRNELYPVTSSFYDKPELLVERAAATHFGMKAYGVHCNGYVVDETGRYKLWVAKRSMSKPNWPGKLDHIAAGGQPHNLSPTANIIKECEEEASIPLELARTAKPVGAVSYTTISSVGLKPDVLFTFDIQLPLGFTPKPQDGEVEYFELWPIERVAQTVANTTDFKTNCNLVIIDFMLRHGLIGPDQEGYLDLVRGMRNGDCS